MVHGGVHIFRVCPVFLCLLLRTTFSRNFSATEDSAFVLQRQDKWMPHDKWMLFSTCKIFYFFRDFDLFWEILVLVIDKYQPSICNVFGFTLDPLDSVRLLFTCLLLSKWQHLYYFCYHRIPPLIFLTDVSFTLRCFVWCSWDGCLTSCPNSSQQTAGRS